MKLAQDLGALFDCRDAWSKTIEEIADVNKDVVVVVNDSVGSSKLNQFQEAHADRLLNVGIAEQSMVGVAAGLANGGFIPFVSAAACFLTARATEQIKVDLGYSDSNVKLIGQSPGVAYGNLGPTHHSTEDFTWLRTIPNLVIVAPIDPVSTSAAVRWATEWPGPVYIRVPRTGLPKLLDDGYRFEPGKAILLREGVDVTLVGTGAVMPQVLQAADLLQDQGISARVLALPTVAPLDLSAIQAAAKDTKGLVTVEESLVSGFGGSISEYLSEERPTRVTRVGFHDPFVPTGSPEELFEFAGITSSNIASEARKIVLG